MRIGIRSLFLRRIDPQQVDPQASVRIHLTNPWHAVAIRSPQPACPAAAKLGKRRFLSREAPTLPLADCPAPQKCRCIYQHFDDRRTLSRRAADEGRPAPPYNGNDRRCAPGRRKTDVT
jgi:hypothetical protein